MKKSLADMKPANGTEAPKERSFGAFKAVEGNQATIDLEKLREYNIFLLLLVTVVCLLINTSYQCFVLHKH